MMGERQVQSAALFYEFSLERHVPEKHLLRAIDRFVDLSGVRGHLAGKGAAAVFSSASATTGIIVALAVLGQASHNLIARLFLAEAGDVRRASRRGRLRRALHRLSEAFLWILGGAWLA